MEEQILSPFSFFAAVQETYEEAVQKNVEENKSFSRIKHFRMTSPGTYPVRILPIAPVQKDGEWVLDRKGYEYPIKTLLLKLDNPNAKSKKDKQLMVNVCQAGYAGISVDLIDTYIKVATDKYFDKESIISKIKNGSFNGGLKWSSQRCMYIFDTEKRSDGLQILTLSYAQYKDLEERKLTLWKKLLIKEPKHLCPISSLNNAYPVEIIRKEENGKTSYSFNIDTISGIDELTEDEVNALMNAQRLPEALYRYTRFHLEATIEFLKQFDDKLEIDVMKEQEVLDAIEKIKMELPADDKSHFSFNKNEQVGGEDTNSGDELDILWDRCDDIDDKGLTKKSEEYQELRDDICDYIDKNNLNIRAIRTKTNRELLEAIEDALDAEDNDEVDETEEEKPVTKVEAPEEEEGDEGEAEEEEPEEEPEEEKPSKEEERPARRNRREERNDDTNEPAARPARRERPARRVR